MKIKELVEELQKLPQDLDIVIATDEEGNGFHNFSGVEYGIITENDGWAVEFTAWAVDEDGEETGEIVSLDDATAICFWP